MHYPPRDVEAGDIIEYFLVSAVTSILVIRTFLYFTGYPQLGGQNFHIAHMLWGGFLMMVALISLFVFLNKEVKYFAAIVGGVGFGAFIDELGKFITNDNNYFYRPTIAIIYVIFVLLFLGARAIEKYFKFTKDEYTVNALEMTKQAVVHDLNKEEKRIALSYLKKSDQGNPIVQLLTQALKNSLTIPSEKPNFLHDLRTQAKENYIRFIRSPRFAFFIISFSVIATLINFGQAFFDFNKASTFSEWGELIFSLVSGGFVIIGIYFLIYKKSRKNTYQMLKISILFSIFLTQFFRFLEEQLSAITGLLINLVILSVLQYLIYEEKLLTKKEKLSV
jgi:hypothetical protein